MTQFVSFEYIRSKLMLTHKLNLIAETLTVEENSSEV